MASTPKSKQSRLRRQYRLAARRVRRHGPGQAMFWVMAFFLGIAAGLSAVGFRLGITTLEGVLYRVHDQDFLSAVRALPWYVLIAIPATGGLVVGLVVGKFVGWLVVGLIVGEFVGWLVVGLIVGEFVG